MVPLDVVHAKVYDTIRLKHRDLTLDRPPLERIMQSLELRKRVKVRRRRRAWCVCVVCVGLYVSCVRVCLAGLGEGVWIPATFSDFLLF